MPGTVEAGFRLTRDGILYSNEGGVYSSQGPLYWMESPGRTSSIGDQYEALVTKTSGSVPVEGTLGSWVALSSDRTWRWSTAGKGVTQLAELEVQVRRISHPSDITGSMTVSVSLENSF